jgi:hypothetical protein
MTIHPVSSVRFCSSIWFRPFDFVRLVSFTQFRPFNFVHLIPFIRSVLSVRFLPSTDILPQTSIHRCRLLPFIPVNMSYSSNRMCCVHKYPILYSSNRMYVFFKIVYSFLINTYIYIFSYEYLYPCYFCINTYNYVILLIRKYIIISSSTSSFNISNYRNQKLLKVHFLKHFTFQCPLQLHLIT